MSSSWRHSECINLTCFCNNYNFSFMYSVRYPEAYLPCHYSSLGGTWLSVEYHHTVSHRVTCHKRPMSIVPHTRGAVVSWSCLDVLDNDSMGRNNRVVTWLYYACSVIYASCQGAVRGMKGGGLVYTTSSSRQHGVCLAVTINLCH